MINPAKEYGYTSNCYNSLRSSYDGIIPDFEKALCHISFSGQANILNQGQEKQQHKYDQ